MEEKLTGNLDASAQDLEKINRHLLALLAAGTVITSSLDLQFVLNSVTQQMANLLGVPACAISELTDDGQLNLLSEYGPDGWWDDYSKPNIHIEDYLLTQQVLTERSTFQVLLSDEEIDTAELSFMKKADIKTLLMLPMIYKDRVLGLVEIMDHNHERIFPEEEITIAQLLANQAASAIENARLFTVTERRLKEQAALREASALLSSSLSLEEIMTNLAAQLCQAVNATSTYICDYDPKTMTSRVLANNFSPEACAQEKASFIGEIYQEDHDPILIAGEPEQYHVDDPQLSKDDRDHFITYGAKSVLTLPAQFLGRTYGFVEIWESREKRTFSVEEIQLLQNIAQQAMIAIENARLYEQAQQEIAERHRVELALRESQERYALVTQGAKDGIWDWDLTTDEVYFSPRWSSMVGLDEFESRDKPAVWFERIHPDDRERVQLEIKAHLEGASQRFENEHRIRHENGTYRWVLARGVAVREENQKAYRMAGSLSDITDRKRAEERLLHDALHDSLTGLPNRALFMDRLDRAIERSKRNPDYLFAVLFLDLDQFKVINDSLGHSVGDLLLIAIARRLLIYLRSVDTVARLGGDEFVILLEDLDSPEDALNITERIQEEIALPFPIEEHQIFTTVSIGIVMSTAGYDRPDEVLRDADIAMYQAKGQGRATHEVFTSAMRSKAKARLQLENELRRAIGLQEFRIFYQPILSFENSKIIGFEALVRWQHPEKGLLGPPDFIGVAEETGLIIPIDWWVLRQGCQKIKEWQDTYPSDPPLTISVNLSSKHFARLDLYDQVVNILEVTGLDPRHLILEITENTIIDNTVQATRLISKLRELKIQVQIDDFGTGYSSLSYLQKYPIDAIKIDRSFISKMSDGTNHAEIVKTIVTFAKELGMDAIAEGIETEAQMDQLKSWNCQYGQGFLISRPMDGEAAQKLVASSQGTRTNQPEAVHGSPLQD